MDEPDKSPHSDTYPSVLGEAVRCARRASVASHNVTGPFSRTRTDMIHRTPRTLAGIFAAGVLLTGCSSEPAQSPATSPSAPPSTSASADPSAPPSPSSSLSAAEQQAFDEATEVVLAYRQILVDLYSGARTELNDLNTVATGELLARNLAKTQQDLVAGQRSEPEGARVVLDSATPVLVDLTADPESVVVRACIDATNVTGVNSDGTKSGGIRQEAEYTLVRTDYLPAPGWAVTRTQVAEDLQDRTC